MIYWDCMAVPPKSKWDFGELFPVETARKVVSVSELTSQIRRLLEKQIGIVWVTGEITNLKAQGSGHIYFTLKDANAALSCVLFRGELQVDRALLQDGRRVVLRGELTVYEPRGSYQMRVLEVEPQGLGALQAAFEKLKQKLSAEGLFATERKRAMPRYPQRIGLVTSPTGAAIRDVLHVIKRRNPALKILLAPCRVQGTGAATEIADAIRLLNDYHTQSLANGNLDLILVTRGGGSLEDLWAFNEEVVARAIFQSTVPVVSAVGHEIDFTISDFVADLRAATPSAAAEIITEGVFSSCKFLAESAARLRQLTGQQLADKGDQVFGLGQRLVRQHPRRKLDAQSQRLDDLQMSVNRCARHGVRRQRQHWQALADRLSRVRPSLVLRQRAEILLQQQQRLREQAHHQLQNKQNRSQAAAASLRLLGPEQVLARGYSITTDAATGRVVRAAAEARRGQRLKSRLRSGEVLSVVESSAGVPLSPENRKE
jgi:exodeoxyribonuclease VII large subunit